MNDSKLKKAYSYLIMSFVSGLLLVGFLLLMSPSESNFGLSLVPLLFLWFFVYSSLNVVLEYFIRFINKHKKKTISASVASVVMMAIMFSALGQLDVFDVFLLATLVSLGVFYFGRTWSK